MDMSSFSIVPLDDSNSPAFCHCLEEWSDEMREAGTLKCDWVEAMRDQGLGALLARNAAGEYVGMIQYFPTELSSVDAPDHYHIHCCWVHAYKGKGVGDWRGRGIGRALLAAAEEDIRGRGAAGITAWGLSIPVWMRASWYRKQGFRKAGADGMMALMWKPLVDGAARPAWRKPSDELQARSDDGTVRVLSVVGGVCPAVNITQERMRKITGEYGNRVDYRRILIRTPDDVRRWGVTDVLSVNGNIIPLGPPASEKKLNRILGRSLRKVGRGRAQG